MKKELLKLERGDIFLSKSASIPSELIRICTTKIGEKLSEVSHVGMIVTDDYLFLAKEIEAAGSYVRENYLWSYNNKKKKIGIYRAKNITDEEKDILVNYVKSKLGAPYGYLKLVPHFMDWCLNDMYIFRRFARLEQFPICSWLVAFAYSSIGKHFGVKPNAASPDDIWDFVTRRKDIYECILPLSNLGGN